MAHARPPRIPDAPRGARVDGLWEYDVVECFVVGADGRYLELELGAGGHYLALAFDAPRRRTNDFARESLAVDWQGDAAGWRARCRVPRAWLPEPIARPNAFAIAAGELAAHAPTGGASPDFHRPHAYPEVRRAGAALIPNADRMRARAGRAQARREQIATGRPRSRRGPRRSTRALRRERNRATRVAPAGTAIRAKPQLARRARSRSRSVRRRAALPPPRRALRRCARSRSRPPRRRRPRSGRRPPIRR
jgi:hypothetical protein